MKEFFKSFKEIDKSISKIMNRGNIFSLFICILAVVVLAIYKEFYISSDLLEASIILFKTSIFFSIQFFMCGIAIDKIRKLKA